MSKITRKVRFSKEEFENELKTKTTKQIALETGITVQGVHHYIKKYNIQYEPFPDIKPGTRVNNWVVIEKSKDKRCPSGYSYGAYLCRCDCGTVKSLSKKFLINPPRVTKGCKKCSVLRGSSNPKWKGFGGIGGYFWSRIIKNSSERNIVLTVSIEYCWNLYLFQNGKCPLSGEPIFFGTSVEDVKKGRNNASLDRIDSSKGYVEGNVWWVHKDYNMSKWMKTLEEYIDMCAKVLANKDTSMQLAKKLKTSIDESLSKFNSTKV